MPLQILLNSSGSLLYSWNSNFPSLFLAGNFRQFFDLLQSSIIFNWFPQASSQLLVKESYTQFALMLINDGNSWHEKHHQVFNSKLIQLAGGRHAGRQSMNSRDDFINFSTTAEFQILYTHMSFTVQCTLQYYIVACCQHY